MPLLQPLHHGILSRLTYRQEHNAFRRFVTELLAFGYHNALACIFPVFIFSSLALSHFIHIPGLYRYDLLLLMCLGMQALMYFSGLETRDELLVITLFHILGLAMEIHKVNHGSWAYNEPALTKVAGVPLYSGFMYASVASYISQAWRRFDLQMLNWPKKRYTYAIGATIYLNFFTNAWVQDVRWLLIPALILIFFRTRVLYNNSGPWRSMHMVVAFFLIGLFIWFAENISTFLGAWQYTYQHDGWKMVKFNKLVSWFLLIVVSIIIVAQLKFTKEKLKG